MFDLEMDITGVEELEAQALEADNELVSVVAEAVEGALEDGVARARQTHTYQDRSGALTASIGSHLETGGPSGASGVLEATAPYASFVEEGTDAHDIEAPDGGVLAWDDGGGTRFARRVHHPGTAAKPFLQPAADYAGERVSERIAAGVAARVKPALEK